MSDSVLTTAPHDPVLSTPGIGVGVTVPAVPSVPTSRLSRYRVRAARAGLALRAGEVVLCAPDEPATLGMVVLMRCETDGYSPGALIPAAILDYLGPVPGPFGSYAWSTPGVRPTAQPR